MAQNYRPSDVNRPADLAERMRALLANLATRHELSIEWQESLHLDLSAKFPRQPGLNFPLWVALSDDELTCGMDDRWHGDFFPLDDPKKWGIVANMLEGFVTGDTRAVLYRPIWRRKIFWSAIQVREGSRWKSVSTGIGCAMPPVFRKTFVRNGWPGEERAPQLAWGTLLMLGIVMGVIRWIFA